jgi:hypothetical protein
MSETEARLIKEVEALLAEAEAIDKAEDAQYGKGKRGDELPEELKRRETRLKKIREAKAALEAEAKAKAQAEAEEARESASPNPCLARSRRRAASAASRFVVWRRCRTSGLSSPSRTTC